MSITNKEEIEKFRAALLGEDRAAGTVEKYLRIQRRLFRSQERERLGLVS